MMNGRGFGMKRPWLNEGTLWEFPYRDRGKPLEPSERIASAPTDIQTQTPLKTALESYQYTSLFGKKKKKSP
jgi:hypothetical protein